MRRTAGGPARYRYRKVSRHENHARLHGVEFGQFTAAAHLSPLVDYADLDGNLLIANDPYVGVQVRQGKLMLPDGPGVGLTPA
jgi:L-alanine-DL-glutamate epimerase-like enolase superfamily enzyme